jgi:hypothetical protein
MDESQGQTDGHLQCFSKTQAPSMCLLPSKQKPLGASPVFSWKPVPKRSGQMKRPVLLPEVLNKC